MDKVWERYTVPYLTLICCACLSLQRIDGEIRYHTVLLCSILVEPIIELRIALKCVTYFMRAWHALSCGPLFDICMVCRQQVRPPRILHPTVLEQTLGAA